MAQKKSKGGSRTKGKEPKWNGKFNDLYDSNNQPLIMSAGAIVKKATKDPKFKKLFIDAMSKVDKSFRSRVYGIIIPVISSRARTPADKAYLVKDMDDNFYAPERHYKALFKKVNTATMTALGQIKQLDADKMVRLGNINKFKDMFTS